MNCWCQCDEHHPCPAVYRWIAKDGYETALCESCCAGWRANAAEWPELTPARITLLGYKGREP